MRVIDADKLKAQIRPIDENMQLPEFSEEEWNKIHRIDSPFADLDDYKAFFSVFNVSLCNEDGSYKSVYDIFKEASKNYHKRFDSNYR